MKGFAGRTAAVALVVVALVGLAELTQNRPDEPVPGSETTIAFTISARDYHRGEPAAAQALWAVCSSTVGGDVTLPMAAGGAWEVRITPAIGEHGENRLVGCLEDLTLDRVVGDVIALRSSG